MLNGSETSIDKFSLIVLDLYRQETVNTLSMDRSNVSLDQHSTTAGLYQKLFFFK